MLGKFLIASTALIILTIASGCGGGDSSSQLTKAEFVKQAGAICEKADETQSASFQAYAKTHSGDLSKKAEQEKVIVAVGLPPIEVEAEELADLDAPSDDENQIQAIVDGINEAIDEGKEDPTSLSSGIGNPFNKVNKLAREYGLKGCSEAP